MMPYRILCNGTFQKSQEARSGLSLASSHRTSLHNNRYGVSYESIMEPGALIMTARSNGDKGTLSDGWTIINVGERFQDL